MFRFKYHLLILAAALVSAFAASVSAESLECEILQHKLGRLYFSAGGEHYIVTGCRFVVVKDNDTIIHGQIEHAYEGVSLSRPVVFDTAALDSARAFIEPAAIDSTSCISLNARALPLPEVVRGDSSLNFRSIDVSGTMSCRGAVVARTISGNPVSIKEDPYQASYPSQEDYPFDGYFSASRSSPWPTDDADVVSTPAPFFAVLIPNLSKKFNEEGLVTTSLYYRFNVPLLWSTFFQSTTPAPMNRLYLSDKHTARSYPYDPDKGQLLLKNYRNRPGRLSIGLLSPRLKEVGDFFADVVSRDNITASVPAEWKDQDILLMFCPVNQSRPAMSLRYVYNLLVEMNPQGDEIRETLEILNNQVTAAENATDEDTRMYYCQLADRTMQSDLGVFPLFRPTIYFIPEKNLKNARFDESGYLDLSALTKLILPVPEWEEQK